MPTRVFIRAPSDDNIVLSMSSSSLRSGVTSFRKTIRATTLSSKDISASPRLSGYLLIFIAYVVLFVSSIKHKQTVLDNDDSIDEEVSKNLPPISEWKRLSAIIGSASLSGLMILIVLVHFDTFCFPQLWLKIFRDGSFGESIILTLLFLAAIFMVFVSTSLNGLGGVVGKDYNVYFSSWMGFIGCAYTFGLWKNSAMLNSRNRIMRSFRDLSWEAYRKTAFDWCWALFFSVVTFFSLLDIYLLEESDKEVRTPLGQNQLALMLLSSSVSVICCLLAFVMNVVVSHYSSRCPLLLHWFKLESILLIGLIVFWSWAVFKFTGINGLVNGPSNMYFGAWGCFFWSISIFGSWWAEYKPSRDMQD